MRMSTTIGGVLLSILMVVNGMAGPVSGGTSAPPKRGDPFPTIPVPGPTDPREQRYLGISPGRKTITVADVRADLLIVEILNVYCFACQTQALVYNKIYSWIEERPDLKGRIKLLGIAVGNTREEVADFHSHYGIRFPVLPDPDYRAEQVLGPDIHTPLSLYIGKNDTGRLGRVLGIHEGVIEDARMLFDGLVTLLLLGPDSTDIENLF